MKFDNIIVCGDIHGNYSEIINFLEKYNLSNVVIIVAGDFGIGFEYYKKEISRLNHFNEKLKKYKSTIFAIRGNHDDPSYFHGKFDTKYIKLIPDYTIINLNDINILCVGGAVSIDRTIRKKYLFGRGRDWWINETFYYDNDKLENIKNIDVVITHSSPNFTYPYIKNNLVDWMEKDIHLKSDIEHERSAIANLYYKLIENNNIIKHWYYGHYHTHNEMEFNNTKFTCLDINDFKEIII
jgi:predicted phosphodiesterase